MTTSTPKPSAPIPSATLLLCRDGADGLEVLLVKRHHRIDFASGALVFPGGKICEDDRRPDWIDYVEGISDVEDELLPFYVAACREAFEESGILYARDDAGHLLLGERSTQLGDQREAIATGQASFHDLITREGLHLACDCFIPFARWITPTFMPKRFDTWFFLAEAPAEQLAVHDGTESVDSTWLSPREALTGAEQGRYTIIFPTRCNLMLLAEAETVDEAVAAARRRTVVTIEPWLEEREGERFVCIPDDSVYPITAEKAEFPVPTQK